MGSLANNMRHSLRLVGNSGTLEAQVEELRTAVNLLFSGGALRIFDTALPLGSITWDATGAVTGGSGIALTPAGIVGAYNGVARFVLDSQGNLTATSGTFSGSITGATGTFSSDVA